MATPSAEPCASRRVARSATRARAGGRGAASGARGGSRRSPTARGARPRRPASRARRRAASAARKQASPATANTKSAASGGSDRERHRDRGRRGRPERLRVRIAAVEECLRLRVELVAGSRARAARSTTAIASIEQVTATGTRRRGRAGEPVAERRPRRTARSQGEPDRPRVVSTHRARLPRVGDGLRLRRSYGRTRACGGGPGSSSSSTSAVWFGRLPHARGILCRADVRATSRLLRVQLKREVVVTA